MTQSQRLVTNTATDTVEQCRGWAMVLNGANALVNLTYTAKSMHHSTQLNRGLRTQVSDTSKSASSLYTIINKQYHYMTSDRFPVPIRSAVKSNFTDWCCQNLSKHALNALTVQASTTELGKLFQIFRMRAEKKCFRKS